MKLLFTLYAFFITHFTIIHNGVFSAKLKSSIILGASVSPLLYILEFFVDWILNISLYITLVSIALVADLFLGIIVHLFYKYDFNTRKMCTKFIEKSFATFVGLMLFELFGMLFSHYSVDLIAPLKLSLALTVLLFPLGSALGNLAVITHGKFPPTIWFKRIHSFSKTANPKDFIDHESKNQHHDIH